MKARRRNTVPNNLQRLTHMFEEREGRDEEGGEVREGEEGGGMRKEGGRRKEDGGGRRDQGECPRVEKH